MLTAAVRHAAAAGDWQLAAGMVIDGLAISEIIEPRDGQCLAGEFAGLPRGEAWTGAEPYLVAAAVALSAGRGESSAAALASAEGMLGRLPAGQQAAARLAAATIRLAASRTTGDLAQAAATVSQVEALISQMPEDKLAQHPEVRARALADRGAVELWRGHLGEAARFLDAGVAVATGPAQSTSGPLASGNWRWWRPCAVGCATLPSWPARPRPPWPPKSGGHLLSIRPPRRSPRSPGYTWNRVTCGQRAGGSSNSTPPLVSARTN